jgi:thiol-disulfide isomerase/thioredoxin
MTNKFWMGLLITILVVGGLGYGFLVTYDTKNAELMQQEAKEQAQQMGGEDKRFPVAPNFALKDLDGNTVKLKDFKGKVVIIDFWATWCNPCRMEIPGFVELQDEYENDLMILGISVDRAEQSVVEKFAEDYKINYPVLIHNPMVVASYGGIQSIPTTFIVDRDGRVRDMVVGYHEKQYFKEKIESLL